MTLELFTIHHKPDPQLDVFRKYFSPMQVGYARAKFSLGIGRDDVHGRLSDQNPNYCELTGFDEAAKSSTANYIGFMHYRRVFTAPNQSFMTPFLYQMRVLNRRIRRRNSPKTTTKPPKIQDLHALDRESKKLKLYLETATRNYDIFTPFPVQFDSISRREEYSRAHFGSHLDLFMATLADLHPDVAPFIDTNKKPHISYFANMFIMRRDLFDQYWHILSTTLFEIAPKISLAELSREQARVFGYLAERFMAIFVAYIAETKGVRQKELHVIGCDFDT